MIKATAAPELVDKRLSFIVCGYAVAIAALAVWQLATAERFIDYIGANIGDSVTSAPAIVSGALVGLEIFALPFLLRLRLSPLARFFSALFAFIVPLAWATVTMASDSFDASYLFLNIGFFIWGSVSFWALDGPKVMHLRLK